MLNEFSIENFKVFKEFKLKNLKKVNFFVGAPNTGKTSILEALSLFLAKNPQMLVLLLEARAMLNSDSFESLFFDNDVNKPIILKSGSNQLDISPTSQDKELLLQSDKLNSSNLLQAVNNLDFSFKQRNGESILSNISFDQTGNTINFKVPKNQILETFSNNVEFLCGIANRQFYYTHFLVNLNKIIADKNKDENFQKKIKEFNKNIEQIKFGNENKILVQQINTQHTIDLRLFGQGFQFYIFILTTIISGKKYIIIDELENGLHFKSIDLLLKAILNSPEDVQFFITTHNEEVLKRLADLLKKEKDDIATAFNIYYDEKKQLQVIQYNQEKLIFAMDNDNEIRW